MSFLGAGANTNDREADLIKQLRRRLGIDENDTGQYSDNSARDAWDAAVRAVNKFWPVYAFGSFNTVDGQQDYSSLLPVGGKQLVQVFWCAGLATADYEFEQGYAPIDALADAAVGEVTESGYSYAVTPFELVSLNRWQEFIKQWFGGGGVVYDRDSVILIPKPSGSRAVRFVFTEARVDSFGDLTDDIPELADAAWAKALQVGSESNSGGGNAITSVQGADGVKVATKAGENSLTLAARYLEQFNDQIPLAPSPWLEDLRDC